MSLVNISNLSFTYAGSYDPVFENVSFQIDTDWKLGLTGRNGRGKTTFLQLLCEKYKYEGKISHTVTFDYFPFEVKDPKANTLTIVEQACPDCEYWKLLRELKLLSVDESALYRPFDTLSNGEQTKVLLAALFLKENNFLLIDEPTNHLDISGREQLSKYLNGKSSFIIVSHDRAFLDGCVDHILAINKTDIEIVQGNFSSWYANKQLRDNYELSENDRLKKEISRLEKAAAEKASWSDRLEKTKYDTRNSGLRPDKGFIGNSSAKTMRRSKSLEKRRQTAIEDNSKLLHNIESNAELKIRQQAYHAQRLFSLSHVSVRYGERVVCEDVSFSAERGDRIALCGKNGTGKSSLIKLICGEDISFDGSVVMGSRLKISLVPQYAGFLCGDLRAYARENKLEESLFKTILRQLDFSREQFDKRMEDFSEGQKKKVLLAKSLCEEANLHIWDEPLNYIDVISRMQIEALVLEYAPTLLFVEHDRAFCENVATKTVLL